MSLGSSGPQPDADLLVRLARLGVHVGVDRLESNPGQRGGHLACMRIEDAVPGRLFRSAAGACYASDLRRAAHESHGGEALGDVRHALSASLAALAGDPALEQLDPSTAAYLDTETTGLMGSTGTYAFLVGIGRFEGDVFVVRQLFMRGPEDEAALLDALDEVLEGCSGLVTFNGRAYDVPLLQMRYGMHRRRSVLGRLPNLDLLPIARRLWGRRLTGCSLTELERSLLGHSRQEDVPGWLIPERYFRYQRDGDARGLVGIFKHNSLDIVTMASLTTRMARVYDRPDGNVHHGLDWMSLGAMYERARDLSRAASAWEEALASQLSAADVHEALWRLSLTAKRLGDWERAVGVWRDLISARPVHIGPYLELAKYYEHRLREPGEAARYAREARSVVADGRLERFRRRAVLAELDHRLLRLENRMARLVN